MEINALFDDIQKIPSVPEVVREIIESLNDPNANLSELGNKVKQDQVITLKVLRMVNSPMYGLGQKCNTIEDAVVLLGTAKLKTLVVASGLVGAIDDVEGIDMKDFWSESFRVATYAKNMAPKTGAHPDMTFTAGLIHNIGSLLIAMARPKIAAEIEEYVKSDKPRDKVEKNLLGFTHAEVSAELAKRWKFPDDLIAAVEGQLVPLEFDPVSPEAAALHLATLVSEAKVKETAPAVLHAKLPYKLLEKLELDLDEATLEEILALESGMEGIF
ncbi:MAG: HDOD domain-containing protein [Granulosicoccaceae bacterium]